MHSKYILGCILYSVAVIIYTLMINRRLKILKKCENIEDIEIQRDFFYIIIDRDENIRRCSRSQMFHDDGVELVFHVKQGRWGTAMVSRK